MKYKELSVGDVGIIVANTNGAAFEIGTKVRVVKDFGIGQVSGMPCWTCSFLSGRMPVESKVRKDEVRSEILIDETIVPEQYEIF